MRILFQFIYDIQRTERRFAPRVLGFLMVCLSVAFVPDSFLPKAWARWSSFSEPVHEQSGKTVCSKAEGGSYVIEIDNENIYCTGADTTCALNTAGVVYERSNPARCRVESNIGHPSNFELYYIGKALTLTCLGIWLLTVRENARGFRRFVSHAMFYLGVFQWCSVTVWMFEVDEPSKRQWPLSDEEFARQRTLRIRQQVDRTAD